MNWTSRVQKKKVVRFLYFFAALEFELAYIINNTKITITDLAVSELNNRYDPLVTRY